MNRPKPSERSSAPHRVASAPPPRGRRSMRALLPFLLLIVSLADLNGVQSVSRSHNWATPQQLQALQSYIKQGWHTLMRSNSQLPEAAVDPKFTVSGPRPVYLPRTENLKQVESDLRAVMPAAAFAKIALRPLPENITDIREQGLLYLPYPYVVPGGRFNEMYGWDSYFIQVGLLRDGEIDLAKNMIDNFLYEVDCYGKVLNANRTYYLTRSQPPFLTGMILGVYGKTHDLEWLRKTVPAIEKYYRFWTQEPHLTPATGTPAMGTPATGTPATGTPATGTPATGTPATGTPATGTPATGTPATGTPATGTPATGTPATGTPATGTPATGLSRYYDFGDGPAPEVVSAERDEKGDTHYDRVKQYYRTHRTNDYNLSQYYDRGRDELTALFYKGDRSMRESGFDPSNRFGPFNIDIIHYDPVCLNSLLYVMETETSEVMKLIGQNAEAGQWLARAEGRRRRINDLLWDERDGLYYDYNFVEKRVRRYPFVTTFWPLWAGVADARRAARVAANLHLFERPGGLQTSSNVTGNQWDAPFGWGNLQMMAVKGLRRYGYREEADRISIRFLSMVLNEFLVHNTVVEKYDVVGRQSQLGAGIKFGYGSNEIGFGWTNAAFVEMYAELPEDKRAGVLDLN